MVQKVKDLNNTHLSIPPQLPLSHATLYVYLLLSYEIISLYILIINANSIN